MNAVDHITVEISLVYWRVRVFQVRAKRFFLTIKWRSQEFVAALRLLHRLNYNLVLWQQVLAKIEEELRQENPK